MYEIIKVEDVSRPKCKRFVGHIRVKVRVEAEQKDDIKAAIIKATEEIKHGREYESETTKLRFKGIPAHVVRLYVYNASSAKLICQCMWVDITFKDAPLPLPLKYNDSAGDIGIVW